ncbi:MAG: tetratricopeptide repeat protein [Amphiplicatus sp.]
MNPSKIALSALALALSPAACPALAQQAPARAREMVAPDALKALVNAPDPAKQERAPEKAKAPAPLEIDLARKALVDGDFARAFKIAEALAKRGDAAADHILGYLYENGLGVRADIGAALRHYGEAAIKGDANAQIALGALAFAGDGVYADYERAAGWFRLAAAQGDPRGEVRLGLLYAEGLGVQQNSVTAAHYFAKAASKGDADGEFWLGVAWMNGDGVPQSYPKAAVNFANAAKQGHAEAAYHLSLIYDSPVLGAPDAAKAAGYMRAAAEGGYPPAYAAMGLLAHRGDAEGLAADWFEKGARAGDPQSAFLYAVALFEGDGRPKDIIGALALADEIIASDAPEPLKAQAASLKKSIRARTPGPLTLRN